MVPMILANWGNTKFLSAPPRNEPFIGKINHHQAQERP